MWLDEVLSRLRTSWDITVLTRESADRPNHEVVDGIAYVRRGGVFTQYVAAHLSQRRLALPPDVVLDVFNGVPFLSVLNRAHPVVVVVHHVHREQWTMVFGAVVGRAGWATERTCATLQRRCRHVTVSSPSAAAISAYYRIPRERIVIAHNGFTPAPTSLPTVELVPAAHRLVALGRLVPHKRVEVAIAALAAARATGLDVHLDVVGGGEWRDDLVTSASGLDVARHVTFHGLVDDATKHAILARADLLVLPSVREGWGIVVIEAAQHGVPTVAMASAGGTTESVRHGVSGMLAADDDDFRAHVIGLLADPARRRELGRGAAGLARRFTWEAAAATVDATLRAAIDDRRGRRPPTRLTPATRTTTLGDAPAGTPSDPMTDRPNPTGQQGHQHG